jgi:hypothetical protein
MLPKACIAVDLRHAYLRTVSGSNEREAALDDYGENA